MTTRSHLPIRDMDQRHPGLTKSIAASNLEAASVCLHRHHHPPADFDVEASDHTILVVDWDSPDPRIRSAWANETDATEAGACAMVLAAVEVVEGLVTIGRAETMTGADYYVAPQGSQPNDLEECLRLEVSGVDHGTNAMVKQRLKSKLAQAGQGRSNLPAIAGVAGFKVGLIVLANLDTKP